jgi:hypothetical protein
MKQFIWLSAIILAGCGGGGGNSPQVQVQTAQAVVATTAPCTLPTLSSTYPNEFVGSKPVPIATQKFDTTIIRSVGLKDYHPRKYQMISTDCDDTQYSRLLYMRTFDKLEALGVDAIDVYQYAPFTDFNDKVWTVDKKNWQIPESELIWIIQEGNRRKIKVNLTWQMWGMDSKGNSRDISELHMYNMSEIEMVQYLEGWRNVAIDLAKIGGQYGLNAMALDWTAFYFPGVMQHKETATQEFLSIATDIRKYFKGELHFGQATPDFYDNRLLSLISGVHVMLLPRLTENENNNLSVQMLKDKYLEQMRYRYESLSAATGRGMGEIPVIWDVQIQSRDKFWVEGWVEDSFCVSTCIQKTYKTDFSVQAIGVEAYFQAIKEQKYFKNYSVNFHSAYWHTENVTPTDRGWDDYMKINNFEFPNLSQSIRNKPAEAIAKVWFKR